MLNIAPRDSHVGLLIEDFVGAEFVQFVRCAGIGDYTVLHFRTREQQAVDLAIESADRRVVGIEVQAATTFEARNFRGLQSLSGAAGERFHRGVVLYDGNACVPFGPKMWAIPIFALWQ